MSRICILNGQVTCYPVNLWPLAQDLKKLIDASFHNADRMAELLDLNILNHLTDEQSIYLANHAWTNETSNVQLDGFGNVIFSFDQKHISPQLLYCLAVDYVQKMEDSCCEELATLTLKTLSHYYED